MQAGFSEVHQYYRLSELVLEDVSSEQGRATQINQFANLYAITREAGFTSIVVAIKNTAQPSHTSVSLGTKTSDTLGKKKWLEWLFNSVARRKIFVLRRKT